MGAAVRAKTVDRAAGTALVAWLVWAVVAASANHRVQPVMSPYFVSPIFLGVGVLLGRRLAGGAWGRRPALALVLASYYVFLGVSAFGGAGGGPLGYANANAALAVQLAALCALLALEATGRERWALLGAAGIAALAVAPTHSDAASVTGVPLLGAVAVAFTGRVKRRWWAIAAGVIGVVGSAATVIGLAVSPTWPARLTDAFSPARHTLWADALTLWAKRPLIGSGPGSFRRFSPLASDPDLATAHMSLLQVGAETGLVGVLLFAALVAVGFTLAARGRPALTLVMSAALAALLIHSFVDHILEFWPVLLVTGTSLGYVSASNTAHS